MPFFTLYSFHAIFLHYVDIIEKSHPFFFLKMVLARARPAAACRGVLGAHGGRDGAAATLALSSNPGLKNVDFSAVWHLAPILCRVAVRMLAATCHWEHFYTHFAQVSMMVQGLGQAARLLAAGEEEDAVQMPPHGLRDGTSSRCSGSSHLGAKEPTCTAMSSWSS